MDYELAKELKDAGFPQKRYNHSLHRTPDNNIWILIDTQFGPKYISESSKQSTRTDIPDSVYIPTLEELIEACGEDFGQLSYWSECIVENERWEACSTSIFLPDLHYDYVVYSSTPTSVVARLWLALNKKD